jgi:transcriptional regulator with XRE-family HTH domain
MKFTKTESRERRNTMNYLKFLRLQRGLTIKELAERAGISASTLSYIERGEQTASEDVVQKIATALKVSSNYLFSPAKFRIRELEGELLGETNTNS